MAWFHLTKVDLITGLQGKTLTGRPDWNAILRKVADEDRDHPATIFFCGPPGLGSTLKVLARKHGLRFRQETF